MKIKLEISQDAEAKVTLDPAGNLLALEFTPYFAVKTAQPVVVHCVVLSDLGAVLDRFALTVSGANGRVNQKRRAKPVGAKADQPGRAEAKSSQRGG